MKLSKPRKLSILATVQLCVAVLLALSSFASTLLQLRELHLYSAYAHQFTDVDEQTGPPGPFGYTQASFARLVHSNTEQLASYCTATSVLSVVLVTVSVLQFMLARSVTLREDASHAH